MKTQRDKRQKDKTQRISLNEGHRRNADLNSAGGSESDDDIRPGF